MTNTRQPHDAERKAQTQSPGFSAGSEGWSGDEDAAEPVISAARNAAKDAGDRKEQEPQRQAPGGTQSDYSLSSPDEDEDGRFDVAEEQSFDQQSDAARHVGQMSLDLGIDEAGDEPAADASAKRERQNDLKQSIDRAVPPSA